LNFPELKRSFQLEIKDCLNKLGIFQNSKEATNLRQKIAKACIGKTEK